MSAKQGDEGFMCKIIVRMSSASLTYPGHGTSQNGETPENRFLTAKAVRNDSVCGWNGRGAKSDLGERWKAGASPLKRFGMTTCVVGMAEVQNPIWESAGKPVPHR